MLQSVQNFFSGDFMAHGYCFLWKPELVGLHAVSDFLIALAYYSIPLLLIYFVRQRQDIPFQGIFLLFSTFILSCGTGHLLELWTLWHPTYWLSGLMKAITAIVSLYTASAMISLIPKALALPSPAQLEAANLALEREIGEHKQTVEELRRSQQRLSLLVQQTPLAVIEWNLQGEVSQWNPAAERIFGYSQREAIGHHAAELMVPQCQQEEFEQVWQELLRSKGGSCIMSEHYSADGKILYCEWYSIPLIESNGCTIGVASLVQDVTQRQEAEDALRRANEELEERVGKRTQELARANRVLQAQIMERQLAEEALRRSETQLREQASELEQALHQLKQTQTQLVQTEKMSSLGMMIAGIAHEINNPVGFIYGNITPATEYIKDLLELVNLYRESYPLTLPHIQEYTEEIDLDFLMDDLPKLLASMKVGSERIRDIIASLRMFSRLDQAEMKPVNLHEGLDTTLQILQHRLKEKPGHPAIEVVKEYSNIPLIECYAGQINQVFMNILVNAIDALESRQVSGDSMGNEIIVEYPCPQIKICTEITENSEPNSELQSVVVRIKDNGLGMTERVRRLLFDPFFTTKAVGQGTGLGLSISYQIIVVKHGGKLECVSAPREGTEFIIELPIHQLNQAGNSPLQGKVDSQNGLVQKRHICEPIQEYLDVNHQNNSKFKIIN
jgi:PAS domain S-box-containing protein